jgi:membrane-bound metal-dependent hydrolase YbcI (DUF457 family)
MMGAHHAISGAAAWLAITATAPALPAVGLRIPVTSGVDVQTPEIVLLGALVVAGWALVADLDHPSATAAHSIPILGKLAAGAVSTAAGGHRKGTHTVWAVIAALVLAWFGSLFVWDTGTSFGTVSIGLFLLTAPTVAFAARSITILRAVNSWPKAWLVGIGVALLVTAGIRSSFGWILLAVALGYAVHLAGDYLTVEGIPPTYPWVPKPPQWWSANPVLTHLWHENGYISLPVLGKTGSVREWCLAIVLTAYVLYVAFYEVQTLLGVHSIPHL